MRSRFPFRAAFVPSIRKAYLPSRTGSCTTLTLSVLGAPFHCSVVPVSKSPRQMTSAETEVIDINRIVNSKPINVRLVDEVRVEKPVTEDIISSPESPVEGGVRMPPRTLLVYMSRQN